MIERGRGTDCHCRAAETGYRQGQNKGSRGKHAMKQESGRRSEINRQM